MKKIIYTFVLGLLFVACDKNNDFDDIAPVAEIQNVTIESKSNVDLIIGNLLENLSNYTNSKSKRGINAGKGQDFVAIHIFEDAGVTYMTLLDETNDDLCFGDTTVATVFFDNANSDGSLLNVEDTDGDVSVALEGDFSTFFSVGQNLLLKLDSNSQVAAQADFNDTNNATFSE